MHYYSPQTKDTRRLWHIDNPHGRVPATAAERYRHQLLWRDFPWPEEAKPASRLDEWDSSRQAPAATPSATPAATPAAPAAPPKSDKWRAELDAKYGRPTVDRHLFALGHFKDEPVDARNQKAVATHEVCHALLAVHHGVRVTDVFATLDHSGYCEYDATTAASVFDFTTRDGLLRWASYLIAGIVGEEIGLGSRQTNDTSEHSDLARIEKIAHLHFIGDPDGKARFYREARGLARKVLTARWGDVERAAAVLQEKHRLTGDELAKLLPPATTQVRKATMPLMVRSATMNSATNNEVELVWTTGASVRRSSYDGPYDEVLETGQSNVRLGRLNAGAPLLNSHDSSDLSRVLGSVVPGSARMVNGQGIARIKLSARAEVAGFVQDIVAGVIKNTSVGYKYHRVEIDKRGDVPVWRVTDWEPMEISAVAVGADALSQFRGDAKFECEVRG